MHVRLKAPEASEGLGEQEHVQHETRAARDHIRHKPRKVKEHENT